jgi:amino-acid N-acetyltransferase
VRARRARLEDVAGIHRLVAHYAAQGLLLPRAEDEIREHIGRFLVLTEKECSGGLPTEQLLGCVALEPYGPDLAEIRSLAIAPEIRGHGLGTRLLQVALAVARRRKIACVFAVTHAPEFFTRQGFATSTRWALPEKLARDCRTCPKAPTCELVAVIATVCPKRVTLPILATAVKPAPAPARSGPAL